MTTAELADEGFSRQAVRGLNSRGELIRVRRGVYARADLAADVPVRALAIAAAVAVAGRDAVASYEDAALLHDIALLDRPRVDLISVSKPDGHDRLLTGTPQVRIRATSLARAHVAVRGGVPVTSAARTVVDLARTVPFRSGVVAADSALHQRKTTARELDILIAACRRWPGIERARRVAGFATHLAESPFESIARVVFDEGGLPQPELQVWVGGERGPVGRVDFLWSAHRTIAEADGALKYADPDRARQQLHRDAELRRAGFEVVHFSWRELAISPAQVIGWITDAFGRAGSATWPRSRSA